MIIFACFERWELSLRIAEIICFVRGTTSGALSYLCRSGMTIGLLFLQLPRKRSKRRPLWRKGEINDHFIQGHLIHSLHWWSGPGSDPNLLHSAARTLPPGCHSTSHCTRRRNRKENIFVTHTASPSLPSLDYSRVISRHILQATYQW